MNELYSLGQSIKEQRLLLNLRMEDVAQKAGITRATLWSIEKGRGCFSAVSLFKVLNILGLSFRIDNQNKSNSHRNRTTRINTIFDKKLNRTQNHVKFTLLLRNHLKK